MLEGQGGCRESQVEGRRDKSLCSQQMWLFPGLWLCGGGGTRNKFSETAGADGLTAGQAHLGGITAALGVSKGQWEPPRMLERSALSLI